MQEEFLVQIYKMYKEFDEIIERNNFDLMQEEVQKYSRQLDDYIVAYMRARKTVETPIDPLEKS